MPNGDEDDSDNSQNVGYHPCGCRDCMEIAIGTPGSLCNSCEEAGCEEPKPGEQFSESECNKEPEMPEGA